MNVFISEAASSFCVNLRLLVMETFMQDVVVSIHEVFLKPLPHLSFFQTMEKQKISNPTR